MIIVRCVDLVPALSKESEKGYAGFDDVHGLLGPYLDILHVVARALALHLHLEVEVDLHFQLAAVLQTEGL